MKKTCLYIISNLIRIINEKYLDEVHFIFEFCNKRLYHLKNVTLLVDKEL